jgi:hypothetical protein
VARADFTELKGIDGILLAEWAIGQVWKTLEKQRRPARGQ